MDTSSAAAECITLMAAAGAVVHFFPTGQGNIIGNPIEPVIKLTANAMTAATMSEHIDLDVSGLLTRELRLSEAADRLLELLGRTANGRLTFSRSPGPPRVRDDQALQERLDEPQDRFEAEEGADVLRLGLDARPLGPRQPAGRLDGQLDPLRPLLPAPDPGGEAIDDEERRPGRALEASFPMRRDLRTYLRRHQVLALTEGHHVRVVLRQQADGACRHRGSA